MSSSSPATCRCCRSNTWPGWPDAKAKPSSRVPAERPSPLAARYRPADLVTIDAALERQASAREAAGELRACFAGEDELSRFGDPAAMFLNVNTPGDLERAEGLLAAG